MVLVHAAGPVLEVHRREGDVPVVLDHQVVPLEGVAVAEVVELEGMRLVIEPVEGDLDGLVEAGEPHRLAHEELAPDAGLGARQLQVQQERAVAGPLRPGSLAFVERDHRGDQSGRAPGRQAEAGPARAGLRTTGSA